MKRTPPKGATHVERAGRGKGVGPAEPIEQDPPLTPDQVMDWMRGEVSAVTKEAELRIRDVTTIATEYARGRISPQEANERLFRYDERWGGDALGGMYNHERMTDEEILRKLDETARWLRSPQATGEVPYR